jgi:hypothetical protein
MGGNVQRLHCIARQIWELLEEHDAFLTAVYVASAANIADQYTRGFTHATTHLFDLEVQLNPAVFRDLILTQGPFTPCFDWFASCFNSQLPRFCAWQEGLEGAELVDAFAHDWSMFPGYMFPPFGLLPKVLRKVCDDKAKIVIVHPDWPGALWKPLLDRKLTIIRMGFYLLFIRIPKLHCHFWICSFRADGVPEASVIISRLAPVSNRPESTPSHDEVVLECLMGRWGVSA